VTRYLAVGAMALCLALGGLAWWQSARAARLALRLDASEALVAGYEAAAKVHRAHIARLEQIRAEAATLDRDIQETEGADAPLDPRLLPAARRVWP